MNFKMWTYWPEEEHVVIKKHIWNKLYRKMMR